MIALLKVGIIFIALILLQRTKIALTWIIFGASFAVGILFNLSIIKTLETILKGASSYRALTLLFTLYLIAILEAILRHTGGLREITERFTDLIKNPLIAGASLPALLGFLPSAGGARFSAPLASTALENTNLKPDEKAYVNYWFRHIWEPFLPIYPALILAVNIVPLNLSSFIKRNFIYTLIMVLLGWLVIRNKRKYNSYKLDNPNSFKDNIFLKILKIIYLTLPIIIPVISIFIFKNGPEVLLLSLGFVVMVLLLKDKISFKKTILLFKESFKVELLLLVGAVLAFKEVLEVCGALSEISVFFKQTGMSPFPIFTLLPFITGLLTGISQAYVGITFPLLKIILPENSNSLTWFSTAYLAGFMGVMLSPVHLCLILTKDYFKANLLRIYRPLIASALPLLLITCILFYFH